jgi:signal transduction histidine kinase
LVSEGAQAQRRTDLAQYLHGEVQAGLTASSLLLQRAAESGDSDLAQEALERASGLLNQDLANISYTRMAPPELKIRKMIEAWKGIADISIDLPAQDMFEEYVFRNAVKLIEEAVANAIRHAKADVIKVSGVMKSEVLTITVISNGDPMAKGKAGLGTQLF